MAKKNSSAYFEQRIADHTWKTYNSLEEKNRELLEFYMDASKSIKDELYALAEKYSRDGVLSLSDMHKQHRLTNLKKRYEKIAKKLGDEIEAAVSENMQTGFQKVYEETSVGVGFLNYSLPNKELMEKLQQEPWRGDSFSGRLWKNQKKLASGLNEILLTGLQQGKTITEIAVNLHNFVGGNFNNCHRLVRTETMHYLNEASKQSYRDAGVKMVQFWAAEDERTCPTCGTMHGQKFLIDEAPVLPLHPNCRCTYLPVVREISEENANKIIDIASTEPVLSLLEQADIIEIAKRMGQEALSDPNVLRYGNGYPITDFLNRKLGYNKLPTVVQSSEFDKLKSGKHVLYRGVTDTSSMSAKSMVEEFKYGEFYAGKGIYGYGTYTDIDRTVAEYYSSYNGSGEIMEMILSDDARTVSFLDIFKEYEKTGIPNIIGDKPEAYQDIIDNVGSYASIKGYDAITLDGYQNKNHVVILNRGKVIVKEDK